MAAPNVTCCACGFGVDDVVQMCYHLAADHSHLIWQCSCEFRGTYDVVLQHQGGGMCGSARVVSIECLAMPPSVLIGLGLLGAGFLLYRFGELITFVDMTPVITYLRST